MRRVPRSDERRVPPLLSAGAAQYRPIKGAADSPRGNRPDSGPSRKKPVERTSPARSSKFSIDPSARVEGEREEPFNTPPGGALQTSLSGAPARASESKTAKYL